MSSATLKLPNQRSIRTPKRYIDETISHMKHGKRSYSESSTHMGRTLGRKMFAALIPR